MADDEPKRPFPWENKPIEVELPPGTAESVPVSSLPISTDPDRPPEQPATLRIPSRAASRISRAPPPAPRLEPNSGSGGLFQSRIDHEREDRADRRTKHEAAYDQHNNETSPQAKSPEITSANEHSIQEAIEGTIKKYLPEIVAFISLEALAIPFFHAGAEAMLNGHLERGFYGYVIGGVATLAGFTYHWWKSWRIWNRVKRFVVPLWPAPILLAFVYVAGPEMYRRATRPVAVTGTIGAMPIGNSVTGSPFGSTIYTEGGPIGWVLNSQFLVTSYGASGDLINSVFLQGKSRESVGFKEAYAISGLTGHRQSLLISVPNKGAYQVPRWIFRRKLTFSFL